MFTSSVCLTIGFSVNRRSFPNVIHGLLAERGLLTLVSSAAGRPDPTANHARLHRRAGIQDGTDGRLPVADQHPRDARVDVDAESHLRHRPPDIRQQRPVPAG